MASKAAVSLRSLGFQSLSDSIHIYTPPAEEEEDENEEEGGGGGEEEEEKKEEEDSSPGLIIICTWAFAQEKHIVKYLAWYLRIYPSSHILLLQSDSASLLWKPNAWQAPVFDPAVRAVEQYYSSSSSSSSKTKTKAKTKNGILLHVFSNGGCYTAVQLAEFYSVHQQRASATTTTAADAETTTATTTTSPPQELPIRAFILDSSPGAPGDSEGAIKALSAGFSGGSSSSSGSSNSSGSNASLTWWLAGQTLAYLAVGTTFALTATGLFQPAVAKAWARLKDAQQAPAVVNVRIARTYLFSDADQMIRARDVKLHARLVSEALDLDLERQQQDVEGGGGVVVVGSSIKKEYLVRCEEFTGTPHVNHMASDPERYWRVVKETWAASALLVGEER